MSIAAITVWNEMQQDPSTAAVKGKSKSTAVKAKQQPHSQPPRPITILEALAASGLRSIRYALELPSPTLAIRSITTNDYSPLAVEAIRANAAHNNLSHIIQPSQGDAAQVMYTCSPRKFSVVDLDPYGSSSPFIDAAVQAVEDGGLLLVTCTDMAVLAGGQSDICFAKYGTCNLSNTPYCHEMVK